MDSPSFFGGPAWTQQPASVSFEPGDLITYHGPGGVVDHLLVMARTTDGIEVLSGNALLPKDDQAEG